MHTEILTEKQKDLLPYIKKYQRGFYLVGGTAIALHIGHRRSIDFDLFTPSKLNKSRLKTSFLSMPYEQTPIFEDYDQLHLLINQVKVTFFSYPFPVEHNVKFDSYITLPSLLSLAAMKAYALGRRAKWKDYVDMYFIIKNHFTINEISREAKKIFDQLFSEKLFREQLAFHKDIDYSEPVEYLVHAPGDEEIKTFLIERAIEF